ncbi:hypothetical protein [Gordonia paraffinivorans]|uniref:hypothetical protein n=1 Tax=Gordonia paraffinivorans TaxID=175628 RepID=UPI001E617C09|nr:hypothetical protein [Gordonia paraffinivorans]MCD2146801.1 hypothetical protein [Gordonia paraffinivorans]
MTGGIAVVALIALVATLIVVNSAGSDDSAVASGASSSPAAGSNGSDRSTSRTPSSVPSSRSGGTDYVAVGQIRAAMQNYVAAHNARNVDQMRAAVCTQSRERITEAPPSDAGTIVLDGFLETIFDGNVAQTEVVAHLEKDGKRTRSATSKERFLKERGSWIYCPGAEPDIGA